MTELTEIRQAIADAQARVSELAVQAELASDRGARGPSPKEIADAEWLLDHHRRRLDLARGAMPLSQADAMRRTR